LVSPCKDGWIAKTCALIKKLIRMESVYAAYAAAPRVAAAEFLLGKMSPSLAIHFGR